MTTAYFPPALPPSSGPDAAWLTGLPPLAPGTVLPPVTWRDTLLLSAAAAPGVIRMAPSLVGSFSQGSAAWLQGSLGSAPSPQPPAVNPPPAVPPATVTPLPDAPASAAETLSTAPANPAPPAPTAPPATVTPAAEAPAAPPSVASVPAAPSVQRPVAAASTPNVPAAPVVPAKPVATAPVLSGSLSAAIAATPAGQSLSLGVGAFSYNNFGSNPAHMKVIDPTATSEQGFDVPASMPGISGAGVDRSILRMAPNTSTHAKDIPTTAWMTNQYSLMRVAGSPNLHDFTLQGTNQGHLYNGLRMDKTTNARVSNVKITGVPGNASSPPGETFGLNDYRSLNSVYKNIEIDGQGVGASGFGANDATNLTIEHGYFHGNPHGIGATFWQTKDVTLTDCTSSNNHNGFNFERVSGTVNIIRPTISHIAGSHDISIGTDQADAVYNIVDPVLAPGQKLRILVGKTYLGKPSPQKKSDVHVIVNGVDRTNELVQWV